VILVNGVEEEVKQAETLNVGMSLDLLLFLHLNIRRRGCKWLLPLQFRTGTKTWRKSELTVLLRNKSNSEFYLVKLQKSGKLASINRLENVEWTFGIWHCY
jgi:hypothetical protein